VEADGTAVITKPKASGGRVSFDTVRHQLLYEVHDPARYLTPDVVADFTSATVTDEGDDRVRITGVSGAPATDTYKTLLCHHAGWAGEARVAYSWPEAREKATVAAAIFAERVAQAGLAVREWNVELWGVDALGGPTVPPTEAEPPEVVARIAWRCDDPATAGLVGREMVPLTLSAPPAGTTGMGRGAARPTELLGIWPTLIEKSKVDPYVSVTIEET
ncbi:MAG TPA: acyclic terpene utilization AtuA family protein, partial [Acidimicrobiia bacterium]|nr:acyclic terpene utilization AtuA family protein [Acidimicrobiia bacterium]